MAKTPAERQRDYRARLCGERVKKGKPGPKAGYKQAVEHVAKRKRFSEDHHAWLGDQVSPFGGRTRALRAYPEIGPCVLCGSHKSERHHIDGKTANNAPENILILCRRCHMQEDGRLEQFRKLALANQPKAVAARWR